MLAGWVSGEYALQTAPHHFGEAHLVFRSNTFGIAIQVFRNLDLRLNHHGKIPSWQFTLKSLLEIKLIVAEHRIGITDSGLQLRGNAGPV